MSKVFVGGLPAGLSSDALAQHFESYGTIIDVVAMRQRGFGFVEFEEEHSAQAVLDAAPHTIGGKETTVKVAETREKMAENRQGNPGSLLEAPGNNNSGPPSLPNKLFVGGLPRDVDTQQLEDHFSEFGALSDAVVMPTRGFGFVAFHEKEAMEKALAEEHFLKGSQITLRIADGQRPAPHSSSYGPIGGKGKGPAGGPIGGYGQKGFPGPGGFGGKGGCMGYGGGCYSSYGGIKKVFVGGIPKDLTTTELRNYFSWYGPLVDAVVMAGRGFGFVEYADQMSADRLMSEANNISIGGMRCSLRLADGKKSGKDGGGGGGCMGGGCMGGGCMGGGGGKGWGNPYMACGGSAPSRWAGPSKGGYGGGDWGGRAPPVYSSRDGGYGPARGRDDGKGGGGGGSAPVGKIFVKGLPEDMTDQEMKEYFSQYGGIADVKVMTGRGFGFVTFVHPGSTEGAMADNHEIRGCHLQIKQADGKGGPRGGSAPY
eukprot:CAMPEP_0206447124 /NCGR_PEP_ID=MMETSP0324_2-20121206/16585_1 /ASSEMBLY_ACC=CAM_ASM_000836 /TAXON_ID=2866 /ORGANISM="Crypthecodinium cohnii, Strain Seligo" /LENGTH=483 /DNA_ID=CAMNT_0053915807 /DNA_START=124 /DNA_END=1575 /DNA_ORIENTATION=+